jgi:SAM-dependent methyltransferase
MIDDTEYHVMAEVETNHWWYRTLRHAIYKKITEAFGADKHISILDAGCGTGGTMLSLKNREYVDISGFDISAVAVDICKRRQLNVFQEDIRKALVRFDESGFDVIVCTDILYFLTLDEVEKVLMRFSLLLKPDGILLINVPALKAFRGIHDVAVGITYRYSKKTIESLFSSTDMLIREMYYWPFLLSKPILFARMYQRLKLALNKETAVESDLKLYSNTVNTALFWLNRLESAIFGKRRFIGSSLFICACKKNA